MQARQVSGTFAVTNNLMVEQASKSKES